MIIPRIAVAVAFLGAFAPFASADCLPSCEIGSTAFAYAPPATVLASGDNLTWTSEDSVSHTATSPDFCLNARIDPAEPGRAFFRILGGSLQAAENESGPWRTCSEATALGEGGFALTYRCLYHPTFQNGVVVVTP